MRRSDALLRLAQGLRKILLWLGRWVLEDLIETGTTALLAYMRGRVRVFRWRLRHRARAEWRRRVLRGRIRRWNHAIRWIDRHARRLRGRLLDRLASLSGWDSVPYHSLYESEQWCRRHCEEV